MYLHIAGTLEFLINHIVHPGAGLNKRGGDNGEASAALDIPCGAEETLGLMERSRIHAAGKGPSGGVHGEVVGACKPCDGVHKHYDVLAAFNKAHGPAMYKLRNLGVVLGQFIEGGVDNFALDGALHVRDLLGPLVDKENDEVYIRIVGLDAVRNSLQKGGFTCLGLGNYHSALALADGRKQVDEPYSKVAVAGAALKGEP